MELGWKEIIREERYVKRVSGRFGWTLLSSLFFLNPTRMLEAVVVASRETV